MKSIALKTLLLDSSVMFRSHIFERVSQDVIKGDVLKGCRVYDFSSSSRSDLRPTPKKCGSGFNADPGSNKRNQAAQIHRQLIISKIYHSALQFLLSLITSILSSVGLKLFQNTKPILSELFCLLLLKGFQLISI